MLRRHVTPTRIVLSGMGLVILAAIASQLAVSRRIGFGVSFLTVIACAAAIIVL